jgi:hypothetical protein
MRERERERDEPPPAGGGSPVGPSSLRDDAQRLLAATNAYIDRALSQDSARFLAANRQHGGQ